MTAEITDGQIVLDNSLPPFQLGTGTPPSTMSGTLSAAPVGQITSPSFNFAPTDCVDGFPYECQVVITNVGTTTLDQTAGTLDVASVTAEVLVSGPFLGSSCKIGPIDVGSVGGVFNPVTDVAVISSGTFDVPEAKDCSFATGAVNAAMDLPTTGSVDGLTLEF